MARKTKPKQSAPSFTEAVERFKAGHPDKWEELRLCPLQHGLEAIAETLNK